MSSKVLFVTPNEVKRKSIIDGNLDDDKLIQFIEVAQDLNIQGYLGTKLYIRLMDLIFTNEIEDSEYSDYKSLLDNYISPMLVWYTQCNYIPFAPYQITNGGVGKHTDENSNSIEPVELDHLLGKASEFAEFYAQRFVDYMCDNSEMFPEYSETGDGGMSSDRDVNYSGWVL